MTFYNPQYPAYQQPYYGNPYAQSQAVNMMQDQQQRQMAAQLQQQQAQLQQVQPLAGRTVSSEIDIAPNETPSTGASAYFPVADGSCIYVKRLNHNNVIETTKFVPSSDAERVESPSEFDMVMDRLNKIEEAIVNISAQKAPARKTTAKKEVDNA